MSYLTRVSLRSLFIFFCYFIKDKLFQPILNAKFVSNRKVDHYGQNIKVKTFLLYLAETGPGRSVGRVSASGNGRSRVRSRAATYQSRQNGTSCSSVGTQTDGAELGLVDPVSG